MKTSFRLLSQQVHLSLRVQFVAVILAGKCLQGAVGKLQSSCLIRHVAS